MWSRGGLRGFEEQGFTKSFQTCDLNATTGEVFYDADGSGTKAAARKIA